MNSLSCNVESCLTNKSGGCCRPSIKVEGAAANSSSETICSSYQYKGAGTASMEDHYTSPNVTLDVLCSAAVCCYNKEGRCDSDSVSISCDCGCSDRSACATFRL